MVDCQNLSQQLSDILRFFREAEDTMQISISGQSEVDKITQDILHDLELNPHDAKSRSKIVNELIDTRKQRRIYKDNVAMLTPVVEWVNANKVAIKALERTLGAVRKEEERKQNRIYMPRVRKV